MPKAKVPRARKKGPIKARAVKLIPKLESEASEREYVDWSRASFVRLPNLKPSTTTISLRIPVGLLERIKIEANKRDMPYQSLIKAWLTDDVGKSHP